MSVPWNGREIETLADIPPQRGGILLIGINPAPKSVDIGHYYQGNLGKRLWSRLRALGLLSPQGAWKDEAFSWAGNGLTDLVKLPTASAADLPDDVLEAGVEDLKRRVREWEPGLLLFAFREVAKRVVGQQVAPGRAPAFEDIPTFLLTGPYASSAVRAVNDAALLSMLEEGGKQESGVQASDNGAGSRSQEQSELTRMPEPTSLSQPVTAVDIENGRIRFPHEAKRHFPNAKAKVEIVVRGSRTAGSYDPRVGPDRERSAVLRVGQAFLQTLVQVDERLRVSSDSNGVVRLE